MNKTIYNLEMSYWESREQLRRFKNLGAKLGIDWNKLQDNELRLNDTISKEGIVFVIAQEDAEWRQQRGRSHSWFETINVKKDEVVLVLKDGKPLWYRHDWLRHRGAHGGKGQTATICGRSSYSYNTYTFGSNIKGLQSITGLRRAINEEGLVVKYLHLSLKEDMPYMTAQDKANERRQHLENNLKWKDDKQIKEEFWAKMSEMYKSRLNDPVIIKQKFRKARQACINVLGQGTYEQQARFAGMLKNLIKSYQAYEKERKDSRGHRYDASYYINQKAKEFQTSYLDIVQDREHWNWSRSGYISA
tara:strand:+ start:226 stop:1137 length:912 start_codon:yes stop_codon:yes gene_type:complete